MFNFRKMKGFVLRDLC